MQFRPTRRAFAAGAAAVLCSSLVACTPSASTGDGAANATDSQKLTVWHYYAVDDQIATLESYKESFEAAHDGVTIENVYVPQDQINSKIVTAAGTGTGPDVVVIDGYSSTTLISGGALQPLDTYWAEFDGADQFADGAITEVDDSIYTVQGYVNTLALYYNKDILDEAGVEPPTTVEQLEAAMEAVTKAGHQGIAMSGQADVQGAFQAYPWMTADGFSYENPQAGPITSSLTRLRSWVDKGWLSQEVATWDQNVPFTQWTAGDIAFVENGNWQLTGMEAEDSFEWGVVKLPVGAGKVYLGGEAQGIGVNSKNPDLAWQYLSETFYSKDGQLQALASVGAIPTRTDAAADEAITSDENLSVFADVIKTQGAPFPDTVIPSENNEATILAAGQAVSAALGGQTTPEAATEQFLKQLEGLLKSE